jgi:hypothetical protein
MDPEWAEKVSRVGDRIDTENATQDNLEEYVATKIYLHNYENVTDYELWIVFKEEFENFTTNTFKQLRVITRTRLRAHLLRRGVYVEKPSTKRHVSDVLFSLLQEEEQHAWTDDKLTEALTEIKPITTISLQDRLNSTFTGLVTSLSLGHVTPSATPSSPLRQASANPSTQTFLLSYAPALDATAQPAHETTPAATTQSAYKKIVTVAKVYTNGQKYDGSTSFDYKLTIFYNICKRSGLSREGYATAFPTMLKRLAEDHYYSSNLADKSFKDTCIHMRNFFKGPEYYQKNLTE